MQIGRRRAKAEKSNGRGFLEKCEWMSEFFMIGIIQVARMSEVESSLGYCIEADYLLEENPNSKK